jgi:hypothetical protein
MPDRQQIIDDYLSGLSIPKIITKYDLYRESQFDGKWKRMRKSEVEAMYDIDFHMERSKSINRFLMEQLKQQTSPQ